MSHLKNKYLKYKSKYLKLKNQFGGVYSQVTITYDGISFITMAPSSFIDQILSQELLVDPVTTYDGQTYERKSIEEWFIHNFTKLK